MDYLWIRCGNNISVEKLWIMCRCCPQLIYGVLADIGRN